MKDNVRSWELLSDGTYVRKAHTEEKPFDSQNWFMFHPATRDLYTRDPIRQ